MPLSLKERFSCRLIAAFTLSLQETCVSPESMIDSVAMGARWSFTETMNHRVVSTNRISAILLVACLGGLTACSTLGVRPWQREILSQPEMQFDNRDLELVMDDHFYFSKEGTSGGRGFAGGGCGCN